MTPFPLISKWLPELKVHVAYMHSFTANGGGAGQMSCVLAADLEAALARGVVVRKKTTELSWATDKTAHFHEGPNYFSMNEALLIGQRPIVRERTATLSETQVREALKECFNETSMRDTISDVCTVLFADKDCGGGE